jgi:hypothetical protein
MLLYFEPSINSNEWPLVIEALKILYPRLEWQSGVSLDTFNPFKIPGYDGEADPINGLLLPVTNTGGLNYGRFKNHKEFIDIANKYGIGFGDSVVDGREYLGLNEDTDSIFNSLDETIRKVIKSYL